MREAVEHTTRYARVEPQHLQCRYDAVSAKGRRVPGRARIGVRTLRRLGDQHVKVCGRPAHDLVENLVGALHGGDVAGRGLLVAIGVHEPLEEAHRFSDGVAKARGREEGGFRLSTFEGKIIGAGFRGHAFGQRLESQFGTPLFSIQSLVGTADFAPVDLARENRAALRTRHPARLKEIGKVAAKGHRHRDLDRGFAMVGHVDALMRDIAPDIHGAHDMDGIARKHDVPVPIDVGIG